MKEMIKEFFPGMQAMWIMFSMFTGLGIVTTPMGEEEPWMWLMVGITAAGWVILHALEKYADPWGTRT